MKDKDFKEQNNYREVECCGNCKYFEWTGLTWGECKYLIDVKSLSGHCDKWEHE